MKEIKEITKMKNAVEINKIANEANRKFKEEEKAKALKAVEEIIEPMIEHEAKFGGFSTCCRVGNDVSLNEVIAILVENGYNVSETFGRKLDIEWSNWFINTNK
jgi:ferredoxin-thioredoxin reductase catalytic subunit